MKTGCLGPIGSYSHEAAKRLCLGGEIVPYKTFPAVVHSLLCGETDQIVLPIENTIQGGVLQNMDLLAENEDLFAVKQYTLPIDHRLVKRQGVEESKIKRVFSHPQALGQCSDYLSERLPQAQTVPTSSTAQSLSSMEREDDACIVGYHLCKDLTGYSVSEATIANEKKNFTYFQLVKKGKENLGHSQRVYFMAELPDVPGSLYHLLGVIDRFGLNMNKIESRPIKDRPGEYRFFIEIEGDYLSQKITSALQEIACNCKKCKLLGCY